MTGRGWRHVAPRRFGAVISLLVALLVLAAVPLAGCAREIRGEPSAEGSDFDELAPTGPAPVIGGAGAATDVLATSVVTGVEDYWRTALPSAFGRRWPNIHGFFAIDPKTARSVPCLPRAPDLAGQALYCPALDIIAWDRTGLLPRLAHDFGPGAVVVALAHEMGHAVQTRLGIGALKQIKQRDRYPTILVEGMADCYAGSAVRAVTAGQVPHLTINRTDLDGALRALLSLRDPIGPIGTAPIAPHGNAFDRASAFIDGYTNGPPMCAGMRIGTQVFTQRGYGSITDEISGGNLSLPELERLLGPDVSTWFGRLITQHGSRPGMPSLSQGSCSVATASRQGPVAYCPTEHTVAASSADLTSVHDSLGDYASGTVLVSRYALAALAALGQPILGPQASQRTLCLTGAYTRAIFDRNQGFVLSPGDVDEAVNELLVHDYAARDVAGRAPRDEFGFERVTHFRDGVRGGPAACGL